MNKDKQAELLLEHHKDTYQHILYHWKMRNRLFKLILIILSLIALDSYSPGSLSQLVNAYISKNLGNDAPAMAFDIIGSAVWFLLLVLVIQYYQRSIHVDRQYKYLSNVEENICKAMGGDFITREGKSYYSRTGVKEEDYKDKRPLYLRAVGPLYVYFFPFVLTLLIILKIFTDFPPLKSTKIFNTIIGVMMVCYNIFYIIWVKFKR